MNDTLLLPEKATGTTPPPASPGRPGFDAKAEAAALRATPKKLYAKPEPQPTPEPEQKAPPKNDEPGGTASGSDASSGEPTSEHKSSARTALEIYDTGVGMLCAALVDDEKRYPASKFTMNKDLRTEAERQLAKGFASGNGKFKMSWWLALGIVLLFHGFMNWQLVRKARRESRERKEEERTRQQSAQAPQQHAPTPTQPIVPSAILDRDGRPITRSAPHHVAAATNAVICPICNTNPVKAGRKYCSQVCSGKASKGRKAPTTPTMPATT